MLDLTKKIKLPNKYRGRIRTVTYDSIVKSGVHPTCAKKILSLVEKDKVGFYDYLSLKVGESDAWSDMDKEDLIEKFGITVYNAVARYIDDESDILSAMRWFGRGLPLDKAIKKVLVTVEVRKNKNG